MVALVLDQHFPRSPIKLYQFRLRPTYCPKEVPKQAHAPCVVACSGSAISVASPDFADPVQVLLQNCLLCLCEVCSKQLCNPQTLHVSPYCTLGMVLPDWSLRDCPLPTSPAFACTTAHLLSPNRIPRTVDTSHPSMAAVLRSSRDSSKVVHEEEVRHFLISALETAQLPQLV